MPAERKPNALHQLEGKSTAHRATDTSHVSAGRPQVPKVITQAGFRRQFKELCKRLAERRTLTAGDAQLISIYCLTQKRYETNVLLLLQEGDLATYYRLDSHGLFRRSRKPCGSRSYRRTVDK